MSFYQVWFWGSVWVAVAGLNAWWWWAAKREPHVCEFWLTDEQMQTLVGKYLELGGGVGVKVLADPPAYGWDANVQARADRLVEELLAGLVDDEFQQIVRRWEGGN